MGSTDLPLPEEKLTGNSGEPHTPGKAVQTGQSRQDIDVTAEQTASASAAQQGAAPGMGSCLPPVEVRGKCRKWHKSVS